MLKVKLFAFVFLVLIGMTLVLQNTETVETRLLFYTLKMPRAVLLFGTTCLGFTMGVLVSLLMGRKKPVDQI